MVAEDEVIVEPLRLKRKGQLLHRKCIHKDVISDFDSGKSVDNIRKDHNITKGWVYRILKNRGETE